jgi:hypothetical protein
MKYASALILLLPVLAGNDPRFTPDGEVIRPTNYREWIYLTSGLGMSYGMRMPDTGHPDFDNVFVEPTAYKAFMATGQWPDKTMFILEVRSSESHGSINKAGHFQTDVLAIEAAVKDETRFKEKWAYIDFSNGGTLHDTAKPFAGDSACNACHSKNAAVENTFVQFYPTLLEVAKAKHTLNASYKPNE